MIHKENMLYVPPIFFQFKFCQKMLVLNFWQKFYPVETMCRKGEIVWKSYSIQQKRDIASQTVRLCRKSEVHFISYASLFLYSLTVYEATSRFFCVASQFIKLCLAFTVPYSLAFSKNSFHRVITETWFIKF